MSEPSHQAPLSPASAAHEAFGHLWGVIFLGALQGAAPVPLPFGPVLTQFVDDRSADVDRIVTLIQDALVLSDDLVAIFDEPRSRWSDNLQEAEGVSGWLLLYTRNRSSWPLNLGDATLVRRLAEYGVGCQLYGLVGAITLGVAAQWPVSEERIAYAHEVLVAAAALADNSHPVATAFRSFEAWSIAGLGDLLSPSSGATDEARSHLRSVVDRVEELFDHNGTA